jgi:hypothetical protein
MNNKTIIINARGVKYEVILNMFEKYPKTRLGKLRNYIINRNYNELNLLCDHYNDDLKEFYFNRDPYLLNMMLNYYLNDKLHMNQTDCAIFIKNELDYWQIDSYEFDSCCHITFHEKIEKSDFLITLHNKTQKKIIYEDDFGESFFPRFRENIWNLFNNPQSSVYAKLIFYFSILIIFISTTELSKYILL